MTTFAANNPAAAMAILRAQAAASGIIIDGKMNDVGTLALVLANVIGGGASGLQVPAANVTAGTFGTGDYVFPGKLSVDGGVDVTGAPPTAASSHVAIGGTTRTTIGADGGATALTAHPLGYFDINVAGVEAQVPYYNRGA